MKVHHNVMKKAQRNGLSVAETGEGQIVVSKDGQELARGDNATRVVAEALSKIATPKAPRKARSAPKRKKVARKSADDDEDEDEDGEEEGGEKETASVVAPKYKKRYRPHDDKCGDKLSREISEHVTVTDEETEELRIDKAKLKSFAQANGVWVGKYAAVNVGMQRMNIANRLRAKIKKGHKVVWD